MKDLGALSGEQFDLVFNLRCRFCRRGQAGMEGGRARAQARRRAATYGFVNPGSFCSTATLLTKGGWSPIVDCPIATSLSRHGGQFADKGEAVEISTTSLEDLIGGQ